MIKMIIDIIYKIIDDFNTRNSIESHIIKHEQTPLYGDESKLDSLGMANFIISLEEALYETYKIELDLADEKVFSQQIIPYCNVETLANYIETLVNEKSKLSIN